MASILCWNWNRAHSWYNRATCSISCHWISPCIRHILVLVLWQKSSFGLVWNWSQFQQAEAKGVKDDSDPVILCKIRRFILPVVGKIGPHQETWLSDFLIFFIFLKKKFGQNLERTTQFNKKTYESFLNHLMPPCTCNHSINGKMNHKLTLDIYP